MFVLVCLSVCLSVCLYVCGQVYSKSYGQLLIKICGSCRHGTIG